MSPDGGAVGAVVGWDWEGPPWARMVLQKRRSRAAAAGIAFERKVRLELVRLSGCDKKWGEQPWIRTEAPKGPQFRQPDLFLPVGEGLIVECKYRLTRKVWEEAVEQIGWYSRLVEELTGTQPLCLVVCKHMQEFGICARPLAELAWEDLGGRDDVLVGLWDGTGGIMLFMGVTGGTD